MKKILLKSLLFSLLVIMATGSLQAQPPFFKAKKTVDQSDPQAKKILTKLKDKYSKYSAIYTEYELEIDNRETKEKQSGNLTQMSNMFHVNNDGNEIYCDGSTLWMYMKNNHEVQINEYEEDDEDMMSPSKILKIYEAQDEFVYVVTNEDSRKYDIEFKPVDREADFYKIRIEVLKSQNTVNYIKVFSKDGTIYTLDIKKIEQASPKKDKFVFNKQKYPGVKEVDMR